MYSIPQIAHYLKHPTDAKGELARQWHRRIPHEVGVQGSYTTGNIGDLMLGQQFHHQLSRRGYAVQTFGKDVTGSNAPNRVLGGGGVLHDWYGVDHLERRFRYLTGGQTACAIGVGAPGFHTDRGRRLAERVLPNVDLITVRDEYSKRNIEAICDAEVRVTACPAFLCQDPSAESTGKTGVNFRPFYGQDQITDRVLTDYFGYDDIEAIQNRYLENVRSICSRLDDPVFIPFHHADEQFAREHLDIPLFGYEPSTEKTLKHVSSVSRMVAMRYHSLIFAAVCDRPVLPLAYEPKVEAVADRLGVRRYSPIQREEVPVEFDRASNVDEIREQSATNFDLFESVLAA